MKLDIGNCATVDVEVFFAKSVAVQEQARKICIDCPVIETCKDRAMVNQAYGIWAGMDETERERYRPQWERERGKDRVSELRRRFGIPTMDEENAQPSADARYARRLERAKEVYALLHAMDEKPRRYSDYVMVLDTIIANPQTPTALLGGRVGKSYAWFNSMNREVSALVGLAC